MTTREQVQKLFFTEGGRSLSQVWLTMLYRKLYVDRLPRKAVNEPAVYFMSRRCIKGLRLLREIRDSGRLKLLRPGPHGLQHALEVTSCRVQIMRACREPEYRLARWMQEREVEVVIQSAGIRPDAYFQVTRRVGGEERRSSFFLEVERSGKSSRALDEKLRRYGHFYYDGHYEAAFGTKALRVLFLVGSDYGLHPQHQIERLKEACERLEVSILRFAPLQEFLDADSEDVFFAALWSQPGQTEKVPLFDKRGTQ